MQYLFSSFGSFSSLCFLFWWANNKREENPKGCKILQPTPTSKKDHKNSGQKAQKMNTEI